MTAYKEPEEAIKCLAGRLPTEDDEVIAGFLKTADYFLVRVDHLARALEHMRAARGLTDIAFTDYEKIIAHALACMAREMM